jgi:hypothetical protein
MCYDCERLEFVRKRDGATAQTAFAKQCVIVYRKACLAKKAGRDLRAKYAHGYLVAKRFLRNKAVTGLPGIT